MKLLTISILALLGLAAVLHWFALNPNRGKGGKFASVTRWERWAVYFVLAVVALLVMGGCAKPPSRTVTGGTSSSVNESAQTAVPPSYPPAYPKRFVFMAAPALSPTTRPAITELPTAEDMAFADRYAKIAQRLNDDFAAAGSGGAPIKADGFSLPPGWTFLGLDFHEPIAVAEPTVLNRRTSTTSTTQPSTSVDIIAPENVGKAWIGICLLAAFVCAVIATVTPLRRFYLVAGVAVGLAMIGLVPPVYFGIVFVGVSVVLLVVAGVYMYRTGMWQTTAKQISAGAERVKKAVNGGEEFNTIMEAAQTVPKSYIREAQSK